METTTTTPHQKTDIDKLINDLYSKANGHELAAVMAEYVGDKSAMIFHEHKADVVWQYIYKLENSIPLC